MTIEITQDLVDVAEEFSMSKYSSKLERDAALLQEIVILRKKVEQYESNKEVYGEIEKVDWDKYLNVER